MKLRNLAGPLLVACILLTPSLAFAKSRSDIYNGATCLPYPAGANAVPYSYWLVGLAQGAFCHFTMPDGWSVDELSYVLYLGQVGGYDPLRVQLCVYTVGSNPVCGAETTISPNGLVNWVAPPNNLPASASGAYLKVSFPPDTVARFQQFIPHWVKPSAIYDVLKDLSAPFAGLGAYVDYARTAFDSGNLNGARAQLDAFENEVRALVQSRQVGPVQGMKLLASAAVIRDQMARGGR